MRYIKEYFIQLLLITVTPLIINTLMVQPMLFQITGDSSSWLSFWGSYIGAVLSSAIALYIYSTSKISKTIQKTLQTEIFNFQ